MHRILVGATLLAAFLGSASALAAEHPPSTRPAVDLYLAVDITPPAREGYRQGEYVAAISREVQKTFRQGGYAGRIETLAERGKLPPAAALLSIKVLAWNVAPDGHALCQLEAIYLSPQGQLGLPNVQGTAWIWHSGASSTDALRRERDQADALAKAADKALREVHRRLAKEQLLPLPAG